MWERTQPILRGWLISLGIWILSLGYLSGCTHAPEVRDKGFETSRSTASQLEEGLAPRTWAVVIGVNRYDDPTFTPLLYAEKDARDLAWVLNHDRYGNFDRVITLTGPEQTTRQAILFELARLRNDLRRQDTLVFYFSGHGTMEFGPDGSPLLYLVAHDTRAADLYGTALELGALRQYLSSLKPQRKALVLDSCFAGLGKSRVNATTRARLEDQTQPWQNLLLNTPQSEAVLMASTIGGAAREEDSLGHATYTHFLLRALTDDRPAADVDGDGAITAYEAHDFAREAVVEHTHHSQMPEGNFRLVGRSEIFLSGRPDPEHAKAAALVYAYESDQRSGMRIDVDGRSKGIFPRTVAVEAGERQIAIRESDGTIVAEGRLNLGAGQVYSLGTLIDELQGYRRFFGINAGGMVQARGPAEVFWGEGSPRFTVVSGYRVRGGALRGLTLSFDVGIWPDDIAGVTPTAGERKLWEVGTSLMMRRNVGPLQLGAGWHQAAVYVPPTDAPGSDPISWSLSQPWLLLPGGPVLWQGLPVGENALLTLELRGMMVRGDYDSPNTTSALNLMGTASVGMEMGF